MNSILVNLKDPSWWFTAIAVGIVVSIVAGFMKDWIGALLARFSRSWQERRRLKLKQREQLFEALASNETYLILSLVRFMGLLIVSCVLMLVSALLPSIVEIKELVCSAASRLAECDPKALRLTQAFVSGLGLLTMFVNYRASSRLILVTRALKLYRERHNLPKVV